MSVGFAIPSLLTDGLIVRQMAGFKCLSHGPRYFDHQFGSQSPYKTLNFL